MTADEARELMKAAPLRFYHKIIEAIREEAFKGNDYLITFNPEMLLKNKENFEALGYKVMRCHDPSLGRVEW